MAEIPKEVPERLAEDPCAEDLSEDDVNGVVADCGMPPEHIVDPEERARYEAYLAVRKAKKEGAEAKATVRSAPALVSRLTTADCRGFVMAEFNPTAVGASRKRVRQQIEHYSDYKKRLLVSARHLGTPPFARAAGE